jgi:hypothetical protein
MVFSGSIEKSNTCNGASVARRTRLSLKGTTVFTLLAILGIASVAGIVGSIIVSTRDG